MLNFQTQSGSIVAGDNRVVASVYNSTLLTLTVGAAVAYTTAPAWAWNTGVFDGYNVSLPITNQLDLFCGVVSDVVRGTAQTAGIPVSMPGFIVVSGPVTVTISLNNGVASSITVTVGDKLIPLNGQPYLVYGKAGDGYGALINSLTAFVGQTVTLQAASVFIRTL